jgi:hypothetical protein
MGKPRSSWSSGEVDGATRVDNALISQRQINTLFDVGRITRNANVNITILEM